MHSLHLFRYTDEQGKTNHIEDISGHLFERQMMIEKKKISCQYSRIDFTWFTSIFLVFSYPLSSVIPLTLVSTLYSFSYIFLCNSRSLFIVFNSASYKSSRIMYIQRRISLCREKYFYKRKKRRK